MYADYEYYAKVYLGTEISEEDFPRLSLRAGDYIRYITKGRATDTEPVKNAICAVAERYQTIERARAAALGGVKASETVGNWSVAYRSGSEISAAYGTELYAIASMYLGNTGLLYRGDPRRRCHM